MNTSKSNRLEFDDSILQDLRSRLYRYALVRFHRDNAEDLVQEAILRLLKCKNSIRCVDRAFSFLCTTLNRIAIDRYRRSRRVQLLGEELKRIWDETVFIQHARNQKLDDAINQLSEAHKVVIRYRLADLTFLEIAGVLGVSAKTVRDRYDKAIERLRNLESPS